MRKLYSLSQSRELLAEHHSSLVDCIEGGFNDFIKVKSFTDSLCNSTVKFRKATNASLIHDCIRHRVIDSFSFTDNAEPKDYKNGIFALKIEDELLIRFKKIGRSYYNNSLSISGIRTSQFQKFLGQGQIEGFPEFPTILFAGYIPNATWTQINGIYIACWLGNNLQWIDDIGRYSLEQLNLFTEEQLEAVQGSIRRVKVKEGLLSSPNLGSETKAAI